MRLQPVVRPLRRGPEQGVVRVPEDGRAVCSAPLRLPLLRGQDGREPGRVLDRAKGGKRGRSRRGAGQGRGGRQPRFPTRLINSIG